MSDVRRAVFPGSFDPFTVAHLGIAEAAWTQLSLDTVDLVISRVALAKESGGHEAPEARTTAIERLGTKRPWLRARVTEHRLLVDIAEGYDVLVLGADKWHQLHDAAFYGGSTTARDRALSRLPLVAVAPRPGHELPSGEGIVRLRVPDALGAVSSTAVRGGREDWRA